MADQIKQILHIDKLIFAAENSDKVILSASRFDGRKCRLVGEWRGSVAIVVWWHCASSEAVSRKRRWELRSRKVANFWIV